MVSGSLGLGGLTSKLLAGSNGRVRSIGVSCPRARSRPAAPSGGVVVSPVVNSAILVAVAAGVAKRHDDLVAPTAAVAGPAGAISGSVGAICWSIGVIGAVGAAVSAPVAAASSGVGSVAGSRAWGAVVGWVVVAAAWSDVDVVSLDDGPRAWEDALVLVLRGGM